MYHFRVCYEFPSSYWKFLAVRFMAKHSLSLSLSLSQVKTRFGPTQEFKMEIGGRQGSRLTGRMFAKMMDVLAEECLADETGIRLSNDFTIATLLWVDDVLTLAEGENNQKDMLDRIDNFATKHKIKWGQSKCNVMRVGSHPKETLNSTLVKTTSQITLAELPPRNYK